MLVTRFDESFGHWRPTRIEYYLTAFFDYMLKTVSEPWLRELVASRIKHVEVIDSLIPIVFPLNHHMMMLRCYQSAIHRRQRRRNTGLSFSLLELPIHCL